MRIAFFSWESVHSILIGGIAFHVTELAAALSRKGNEVHVFTRMGHPNHAKYECIEGVHYHRCPFASDQDFITEVNNMCNSFVECFYQTEGHIGEFDIIHAHDWLTVNAMISIKESRDIRAVLTKHSTEYGRCGNNMFGGNSEVIRNIEWMGSYKADSVIAVSKSLKDELRWIYNIPDWKVQVVYNGVNYKHYNGFIDPSVIKKEYDISPFDPMVLFVGRMVYQKGPDLLVEAIPSILKYYGNTKFVFVGDGDMRHSVEAQARHMGVSHATRFLGHHNGGKLVNLFKAADCVCVPSRNEPFGIVILEAWSAGKPVVASSNGGPSEIVWHEVNGLKIFANPDSISWGLGTLFSDFEYARWMGRNGRIAAESVFSWDVIADEVIDVYCEC